MGVAIYLPPYAQSPPEPGLSRGGVGSRSWLEKKLGSLNVLVHKCLFVLVQKDTLVGAFNHSNQRCTISTVDHSFTA